MTATLKTLVQAKYAEAVETVQYVSTNCITTIDKPTVTNITLANAKISVSLVKVGDAAGVSNRITYTKTIAPSITYSFPELVGHILESGDSISTLADTASALVFRVSGRQFT